MRDRDVTGVQTCALPICLKSGGRHDPARAAGHDDLYLLAAVSQPPHEVRTLVGGDAARHAEKNTFALHGKPSRPRDGLSHRACRSAQTVAQKTHAEGAKDEEIARLRGLSPPSGPDIGVLRLAARPR